MKVPQTELILVSFYFTSQEIRWEIHKELFVQATQDYVFLIRRRLKNV